MYVNQLRHFF